MDARYPPMPGRHRLLILLLALAVSAVLWFALIQRPGDDKRGKAPQPPARPMCTDGQPTGADGGCIGGKVELILVPPRAAPASVASAP